MLKTKEEIIDWLDKYGVKNYTINKDLTVDIHGDVDLLGQEIKNFEVKFGIVKGDFYCNYNELTSLNGCPIEIGGSFFCYDNELTTLEGCPQKIGLHFSCANNELKNLEGCPSKIEGGFDCSDNGLKNLKGCPQSVGGDFNCRSNKLINVDGVSEVINGYFLCEDNEGLGDLQGVTSADEIKKILEIRQNKKSLDSLLKINEEVKTKQKKI